MMHSKIILFFQPGAHPSHDPTGSEVTKREHAGSQMFEVNL